MKLESGLSKDDFKEAILKILCDPSLTGQLHSASLSIPSSDPSPPSSSENTANTPTSSSGQSHQDGVGAPATNLPRLQTLDAVQDLLDERAKRLEADKKEKDNAEKAERKAIVESRQNAMINAPESAQGKQASYAQEQRRRQKDQRLERERIIAGIENDKKERKEKEERRRATAIVDAEGSLEGKWKTPAEPKLSNIYGNAISSTQKNCAIQIRLLDGGTIRNHFPPSSTLRTHVRPWILSEEAVGPGGDPPYTFKQILTPLPNRTISISDEEEPLSSLGLMPSATLVKVPVPKFTNAYRGGGVGYISRGVNLGYNALHGGLGFVSGLMGRFLGLGQAVPCNDEVEGSNITQRSGMGEGLEGSGTGRDPQQFYNGNQVCFVK